jgi:hypothetical protein
VLGDSCDSQQSDRERAEDQHDISVHDDSPRRRTGGDLALALDLGL